MKRLALGMIFVSVLGSAWGTSMAIAQKSPGNKKPSQNKTSNKQRVSCDDAANQTLMNECYAREAKRDGELLDDLLKELGNEIEAAERDGLEEVQSNWVKYRDAHCHWQASFFEGGSIQPTIYSSCISAVTWNRIEELKLNLCEGRGMTGPCDASRRYDRRGPGR